MCYLKRIGTNIFQGRLKQSMLGPQLYLLVPDVVSGSGGRSLHGHQTEDLQQMVLHHVADNTEIIEVTAATLRSERFFERDENAGDVVSVPGRCEDSVAESVYR